MIAYELIGDRGPVDDEWGLTQFPEWEIGNEVKRWLDNYPLAEEEDDEFPEVTIRARKPNYLVEVFQTSLDGKHGEWDCIGDTVDVEAGIRMAEAAMQAEPDFIRDWRVLTHWEARSLWENPDQDPVVEAGVPIDRVR